MGSTVAEAVLGGKSDNANGKKNRIASPDALIVEPAARRLFRIIGCVVRRSIRPVLVAIG